MRVADDRGPDAALAFDQQRIAAVFIALAAGIDDDSPALAPVAIDAVDHGRLTARDGLVSRGAHTNRQRLRRCFAVGGFGKRGEYRADQRQNNPGNRQSHKQLDQAEASLMHVIPSLECEHLRIPCASEGKTTEHLPAECSSL